MTDRQKFEIRSSEIRQRLNEIAGLDGDALTDEVRAEETALQTEYREVETKLRAAIAAEPPVEERTTEIDAEQRERLELRSKARVVDFISAALQGSTVTGASAEYRDAMDMPAGNFVPLALFEADRPAVEHRAVTPGVTAQETPRPTTPYVFERSIAASLGVMFPMVDSGAANFPTVTTAPPADTVAKDADAPNTAAAFALDSKEPKRVTGQFEIRREDLAVMPSMESDLRRAISGAVTNELDEQVIAGTNAGGDLDGLFRQAADVNVAGAVETFATGVARFAALVEGRYANGWGDLRAIIGSATFAKYAGLFNNNGDVSLFDYLMGKLGSLMVSNRVPDVAAKGQKALVTRRASGETAIQVPTWQGMEIVRDPFTLAGKGQIRLTAILLVGDPHVPHGSAQVVEVHPKLTA